MKQNKSLFSQIFRFMRNRMPAGIIWLTVFWFSSTHGQQNFQSIEEQEAETIESFIFLSDKFNTIAPAKAFRFSLKALEMAKQNQQDSMIALTYKKCGTSAYYEANYNIAIAYYDSALRMFTKTENKKEIASVYNNLGLTYTGLNDFSKAIDFHMKALQLKREFGNNARISTTLNNLGIIYYKLKAYNKAAEYFMEANSYAETVNDKAVMLTTKNNLGLILYNEKKLDQAHQVFSECAILATELNDRMGLANSHLNIGNVYIEKDNADSAHAYFNKALSVFEALGRSTATAYLGIGRAFKLKDNSRQALRAYQNALLDLKTFNDRLVEATVLKELAPVWESLGNIDNALGTLKRYHQLVDSVRLKFDSAALNNLQAQFTVDNKLKEIQLLTQEKQLQKELIDVQLSQNKSSRALLHLSFFASIVLLIALLLVFQLLRKNKLQSALLMKQDQKHLEALNEIIASHKKTTEREAMLRTIIDASPDLICFKDGKGRWVEANEACIQLYGLQEVDFRYKTDDQLMALSPVIAETLKAHKISDDIALQKGTISRNVEQFIDLQGRKRAFDIIKVPLIHDQGYRLGLLSMSREIRIKNKKEERLVETLRETEGSDRLDVSFISNISHEIRTPLNAVIGFSDILMEKELDQKTQYEYLRRIQENGHVVLELFNELIDLSLIEKNELKIIPAPTHFNAVFSDLHAQCKQLAQVKNKGHVQINCSTPEEDIHLMADEARLRQIVTCLFNYTLRSFEKGSVDMGFFLFKDQNETEMLCIFLSETGYATKQHIKQQEFNWFAKMNEIESSENRETGIGLLLVHRLVQLMKGRVNIRPEPIEGAIVSVVLPAIKAETVPALSNSSNQSGYDLSDKKILVVEDVDSNFDFLHIILSSTGAQVLRANNGDDAIELCKNVNDIDLVLMDIKLPGIDGYEATAQIKKIRPNLLVIAQTAFAMPEEKEACFDAGCDGYFAKPIKARLLITLLFELLNKKNRYSPTENEPDQ